MELPVSFFLLDAANPRASGYWPLIAMGVLTLIYVAVVRPMRKGGRKDPLEKMGQAGPGGRAASTLAQQRAVERDMASVLVEYEEMIRRMTAQLDTRATRLQLLIEEADAKLLQLKQAASVPAGSGPREAADAREGDGSGAGHTPGARGGARGGARAVVPHAESAQPGNGDPGDRDNAGGSHAQVYDLADRGQSPRQIAEELNRPDGEIELILALRQSQS